MARRRRGRDIHGWIVLDKPLGMSSTQALGKVRRLLDAAKAGHGGTLDPLASGVLPIALGEATKCVSYAFDGRKRYEFTLRWGQETATDDAEGEIVAESPHRPDREEILAVLARFTGIIEQRPPAYSAIRIGGRRAYDLARAGQAPEMAARKVHIHDLSLVACPDGDHARFSVDCGKGTYIRSLGRDIARALGTCGHLRALRRVRVGPFSLDDAISLEKLETLCHMSAADECILPLQTALADIPALAVNEAEAGRLRHGQPVGTHHRTNETVCVLQGERPVAIARVEAGSIRPVRVFNI